ncbi:MAG: hypothetical protein AB9846_16795 [Tenuifilaceae bacterium]
MVTLTEQGIVTTKLMNPFPGLRPFHTNEAHLFFGREGQSEEVLVNLSKNKFAAILGASGTGKSSLIYCGLLPILYGGFLHNGRSKWKIVITHPGSGPINNLAHSIAETFGDADDVEKVETDSLINRALLKRSSQGIINVINQYGVKPQENVLLLIDQFEELFRYQESTHDADAINQVDHFINMLVNTVRQAELPVYVVITMRSDFIGECSPFQELTKLINDGHYLIPRMIRDDFQKAITGPVAVGGGKISDQLVQLLLNEMGNNPDELPILQHSLMRTWDYWTNNSDTSQPIGITEYEAIGRLERALSNHANEAYDELNYEQKHTCEILFKSLTEKGADNRGIRRPTSVAELARIAETNDEEVIKIVEIFRRKGRTFLTPPPGVELKSDTLVDISHESLMRVWDKLKMWVEDESSAVKMYIRLAESGELFHQGKTGLWGPPDLQLAINWREKQNPNLPWAVRYNPAFERTMVYLKTSEEEYIAEEENKIRLQKRAIRRSKIVALIIGAAGMISIALAILAIMQRQDALNSQKQAVESAIQANKSAAEARKEKAVADSSKTVAEEQSRIAEERRIEAEIQRRSAEQNEVEAQKQRTKAQEQTTIAIEKQKLADENAERARTQEQIAQKASQEAERRKMLSIAQSMAVKSEQMRIDTLLKGLLAFQAFSFNAENGGLSYDPDIYKSIYSSLKFFKGSTFNVYQKHTGRIKTLAQSSDRIFTAGSDGQVISWSLVDTSKKVILKDLSIINRITLQNDILICLTDNSIIKYNIYSTQSDVYNFPNFEIKDILITQSGKYLLFYKQQVRLTDDYKNSGVEIFKGDIKINAQTYDSVTNSLFIALADGRILHWKNLKSETDKPVQIASIPDGNWGDIAYNPTKNILAAGTANMQAAVYTWNLSTNDQPTILRGHTAMIQKIRFSPNGLLMLSASYDKSVRIWRMDDLTTLPISLDDHENWVTASMFTKDNRYIISGDNKGIVRKFPIETISLVNETCGYLTRELTQAEWKNYVGADVPYKPNKCNNK